MGKVVDITDKLSFEENPKLRIRGNELEVNSDAPTMLKVMGLMESENAGAHEILDTYDLMFPEKSKEAIKDLGLNFQDLIVVVREAVALIAGEVASAGEQ